MVNPFSLNLTANEWFLVFALWGILIGISIIVLEYEKYINEKLKYRLRAILILVIIIIYLIISRWLK